MENVERLKVKLTKGGMYGMYPIKAEYYKQGEWEQFNVDFQVLLGSKLSCFVTKKCFFKDREQINKEINYLLKFICEDCLKIEYPKFNNFKEYAEAVAKDINKELKRQGEAKQRVLLFGKLRKKKDEPYINFEDLIPKSGDFEVNYLATPNNFTSLYISEWEARNLDVPFEILDVKKEVVPVEDVWEGFSKEDPKKTVDDLPF